MSRKTSILFSIVFVAFSLQTIAIIYLYTQQQTLLVRGVKGSIAVGNGLTKVIGGEGARGNWNTAVGVNTLVESSTGWAQTAIGFNALRESGTGKGPVGTGVFGNTAVGYNSMVVNREGFDNTAVGTNTLLNNVDGFDNVALGINSLRANLTGAENTALGHDSLMYMTEGHQNVAVGGMAGRFLGDNASHKLRGEKSIYIGYQVKSASDAATNEIVIGHSSVGMGSNTTTIGNQQTTSTFIRGSLHLDEPTTKPLRANLAYDPATGAIVLSSGLAE